MAEEELTRCVVDNDSGKCKARAAGDEASCVDNDSGKADFVSDDALVAVPSFASDDVPVAVPLLAVFPSLAAGPPAGAPAGFCW